VTTKHARKNDRLDSLRRKRDLDLREIGTELANGKQQLEERAARARKVVWDDFRKATGK
jgi:hypothetical protein